MSPGEPMMFSIHRAHAMPWSPPGLNTLSPKMGVNNLAKATEHHIMVRAMPKNHFIMLIFLYAPLNLSEHMIMKTGMRNAEIPKHLLIKKWEI